MSATFTKGAIIRDRFGSWTLWRIDETYEPDSPFVFCTLVSNHKFHRAGQEKKLAAKERYQAEPDPAGFAKSHCFTVDLGVALSPDAKWS